MRLARGLERRLEALLDGVAGRVFRGPLHPTELAARLLRQADLDSEVTEIGPRAPNRYTLRVSQRDLEGSPSAPTELVEELARAVEETAWERGWRLEGPVTVRIEPDTEIAAGSVLAASAVEPGDRPLWAVLDGPEPVGLRVNRAVLGRSVDADGRIAHPEVSRRHALLWREGERALVCDLGSANGTWVDGVSCGTTPMPIEPGSHLTLGPVSLRFEPR